MTHQRRLFGIITLALLAQTAGAASPIPPYPSAARGSQVDRYHGVDVADPYRDLENPDAAATKDWVQAQADYARRFLDAVPGRDRIAASLKSVWNFERWNAPIHRGDYFVYQHNDGLQNQSVMFVTDDLSKPGHVLLDPNTLTADGTVALKSFDITPDGRRLVYALSDGGSDWEVLRVRDIASGKDLPDDIHWAKFSQPSWTHDGTGFYYTGFDRPAGEASAQDLKAVNEYEKLYFHRLGTPQTQDKIVYQRTDRPDWAVGGQVSDDGHWLFLSAARGTDVRNTLQVVDLTADDQTPVTVVAEPTAEFDVFGSSGNVLYVRTDDEAPRYRVIAIDMSKPDRAHWVTVVPQSADTLTGAALVGGRLVVQTLHDAHSRLRRFDLAGKDLGDVTLPGIGSVRDFSGRATDTTAYFLFDSYTAPAQILALTVADGRVSTWRRATPPAYDPAAFETRQVFAKSRDGTTVPIFVMARKGTPLDGHRPTILYGYGGFNISITPAFTPRIAAWLSMGGVYAVATLRGGGEYGRDWHEAGTRTHKQNVFDDFIAAAQYLQAEGWTDSSHLAILGGSNGGLLVAATEEQRPDLFAAAVPMVGVLDMLRFREFTIGRAWEADYGSVDDEAEFKALLAYSPYHQVRAGVKYPATLIVTADHDDRVYPAHSFKFAAAMQHANPKGAPIIARIDTRAGHGQGMPTQKQIEEFADIYAFIAQAVGLNPPESP